MRKTVRLPTPSARVLGAVALTTLMCALAGGGARAAVRRAEAAPGAARAAISASAPGDTVVLARGAHAGPLDVRIPLTLRGEPGAVVDGGGRGTVIVVAATDVRLEDFEIRGSGRRVITIDAGVHLLRCSGTRLRRMVVRDVLYGIYGERVKDALITGCRVTGRVAPLDESGEGNGIHLWYSSGIRIEGCAVERFLDAIYLSFTSDVVVEDNRLQFCGRYGLHTMYCQENRLHGNLFARNVAGCAIMFSNHLQVSDNDFLHNRGPRTYGLLLRDCSNGTFERNRLVDNTIAVFMDNSNRNRFRGNLLADNGWGLLLYSSCAENKFWQNNFIHDDYPVALDMRTTDNAFDDGRAGNYWSDNAPYDLDADGVSDVPYAPVTAFAFLSKQFPDLAVLSKSPAVAALGVAERVFPALRPSEALDRFPSVRAVVATGQAADHRRAAPERPRPAWAAAALFAGILGAGLAGAWRAAPWR